MPNASNLENISLNKGTVTFKLLTPAGSTEPAQWVKDDNTLPSSNLPYVSVQSKLLSGQGRVISLRYIFPILDKDGKRTSQVNADLKIKYPGIVSGETRADVVKTIQSLLTNTLVVESLKDAIAPY